MMNFMVSILNIKVSNDAEKKELNTQMVIALDLIRSKFGSLTVPEVKEAFKMYVARQFDIKVFRLLDCVAVGEILTEFINFRNESLRVYIDKKSTAANKPAEISDEEKTRNTMASVNNLYKSYRETKELDQFAEFYAFDFLAAHGKIQLVYVGEENIPKNNEAIKKYYDDKMLEAKNQLAIETSKLKGADKAARLDIKKDLEQIRSGISKSIWARAKRLILIEYFDKQITNNVETIFDEKSDNRD